MDTKAAAVSSTIGAVAVEEVVDKAEATEVAGSVGTLALAVIVGVFGAELTRHRITVNVTIATTARSAISEPLCVARDESEVLPQAAAVP